MRGSIHLLHPTWREGGCECAQKQKTPAMTGVSALNHEAGLHCCHEVWNQNGGMFLQQLSHPRGIPVYMMRLGRR